MSLIVLLYTSSAAAQAVSPSAAANAEIDTEAPDQRSLDAPADSAPSSDIVVTGSRLSNSGFTAPTPTTVVGADILQRTGATNVADVLNTVPSFRASTTPSTTTIASNNTGGNVLDLRGLGANRTLVLVDGRRHVPTNANGRVDINVIPTAMIDRVEVVTGGASAAWGSDAVAGVVNLIFKDRIKGINLGVQSGLSSRGDNQTIQATAAAGFDFAGGRGHIAIAAEYADSKGIDDQSSRGWSKNTQLIANPSYAPGNGQPLRLISSNVLLSNATRNGLITNGALRGTEFLGGQATRAFVYGNPVGSQYMIGGSGENPSAERSLAVPLERYNIFVRPFFDISPSLQIFAEFSYARSKTFTEFIQGFHLGNITIRADNPYLPTSVSSRLAPGSTFLMGRLDTDFGFINTDIDNRVLRGVLGLKGSFGTWKWNASYQQGESKYTGYLRNNIVNSNYALAADAVRSNGSIVCRSTLTNPNNGCVPINLFGFGSPSQAAIDYVTADQRADQTYKQRTATASISGSPFSTWAGPVDIATGAEYRKEEIVGTSDAISRASGFLLGNPKPIAGQVEVKEAFFEVGVPLISEASFTYKLDLNAAARVTDYDTSGTEVTWKVGLNWEPIDGIRFRGTRSRDIRAPNLTELFLQGTQLALNVIDPRNNSQVFVPTIFIGNPNLSSEKADTLTGGIVLRPGGAFTGLRFSADYYDIKIRDAITTLNDQDLVDRCERGSVDLCSFVTRNTGGAITSVTLAYINLASFRTRGVDIEANYSIALDRISSGAPGNLSISAMASYVDKLIQSDGIITTDQAGAVGADSAGVPHWRWNGQLTYSTESVTTFVRGRYIGGGTYSNVFGPGDININRFGSQFITDASVEVRVPSTFGEISVYGVVQNLFDVAPPLAAQNFIIAGATNASLYDVVGRSFVVGAKLKF